MKLNRILFAALIASITGSSITSCSESFLDENLTTQYSTDRFKTQEGLDELVTGAYQKLKFKFNYIWGIQCYNMGVDEFTDANNVIPAWNHYSQDLNSSENAANQPILTLNGSFLPMRMKRSVNGIKRDILGKLVFGLMICI